MLDDRISPTKKQLDKKKNSCLPSNPIQLQEGIVKIYDISQRQPKFPNAMKIKKDIAHIPKL